jgi:myo-inositol-1(or 4)-monophosphatase
MNDLKFWLDVATEAALAAGEILQHYWGNLTSIESKGRPGDLVTEADKLSEGC